MIGMFSEVSIDSEATKSLGGRKPLCARDRWLTNTRNNIIWRCTNPKDKKFVFYGGRGIQTLLTLEDLQFLYERDRPDLMLRPSIDRKDGRGNYERDNCRFIEMDINRLRRSQNEYPCEKCGTISFPRTIKRKKYCQPCAAAVRIETFQFPKFVHSVLVQARNSGCTVEHVLRAPSLKPLTTRLKINGFSVNVHFARRTTVTGGTRTRWRFQIRASADFHCLVARGVVFVVPHAVTSKIVYIPASKAHHPGRPAKVDWDQYKNAWHLLAPASESKVA